MLSNQRITLSGSFSRYQQLSQSKNSQLSLHAVRLPKLAQTLF